MGMQKRTSLTIHHLQEKVVQEVSGMKEENQFWMTLRTIQTQTQRELNLSCRRPWIGAKKNKWRKNLI